MLKRIDRIYEAKRAETVVWEDMYMFYSKFRFDLRNYSNSGPIEAECTHAIL